MSELIDNHRLDFDRRRVGVFANPTAGSGSGKKHVDQLLKALKDHGLKADVTHAPDELPDLVHAYESGLLRCIVSAGGDGTLATLLNAAPGVPLTILPLGNENLVARYCGLSRDGWRLASVVAEGRYRRFDLATAHERRFSLMAGAGFDAEVVRRVHANRRGHVNKLSYVGPVWQAARDYDFPEIEVEIEDTGERLRGANVFVFNLPQYALRLPLGQEARPADGLLDVCVFSKPGLANLVRYAGHVSFGRHGSLADYQHRRVKRVKLASNCQVALQTDGDPAGTLPAVIEAVPMALTLVLPRAPGEMG
jgi:diacylglycerol kinase family enzyme